MRARLHRALFAVIGWGALGLQYALLLQNNPGVGAGVLTLNFFSFFTILTNLLAALALTGPALAPDGAVGRWSRSEGVRAAVAMYIVVVGVVYHLLLAQTWNPQGWQKVADTCCTPSCRWPSSATSCCSRPKGGCAGSRRSSGWRFRWSTAAGPWRTGR
jgi:hypothetical protein